MQEIYAEFQKEIPELEDLDPNNNSNNNNNKF